MRPLLVPSSYAPHVGGVEEVAARLAAEYSGRGHDTAIVTNHWPRTLPAEETIDGVAVTRRAFRVPHRSIRGLSGWVLGAAAARNATVADARALAADVVNLHCVSSNAEYALAAARRTSVPLVVSLHGELGNDAEDVYARDKRLRRSWHRVMDAAAAITAPSTFALERAEHVYGAPLGPRATVIRNGVDLHLFDRPRHPAARPFVFTVGRLVRPKGFDILIDAWAQLHADIDIDIDLVIGGDGPERAVLETRAKGLPVRFTGRLDRAGVADHLSACRAFVLPSHEEPLGLTVLEAMAAQAPVVATDAGGVPEVIENGVTGLLVPPADSEAMAAAIIDTVLDTDSADGRAHAAFRAASTMTWSACADAYLDVYRRAGVGS